MKTALTTVVLLGLIASCSHSVEKYVSPHANDGVAAKYYASLMDTVKEATGTTDKDYAISDMELLNSEIEIFAETPLDLVNDIDEIESFASSISKAQNSGSKELKDLAAKAKVALTKEQKRRLPMLRKLWASDMDKMLFRENIDVTVSGPRNTIVTFTGAVFASNANVEDFKNQYAGDMKKLRFVRANYPWYRGADEFLYSSISSPSDEELY